MRGARLLLVLCAATTASAAEQLDDARANVREVLARPEFQPLVDADRLPEIPRIESSWFWALTELIWEVFGDIFGGIAKGLQWVLRKLMSAINSLFSGLSGGGLGDAAGVWGSLVTWAVVIAGAALLVWLLMRLVRSAQRERRAGSLALAVSEVGAGDDDALAHTPEDWRRRAERLAADGDRVEALRALYLELLAGLHRLGAIDYDRTRTNTAYVFDLARGHVARPPFLMLTRRFDRAVYGAHAPSELELQEAMTEVDAVRSAFAREPARA